MTTSAAPLTLLGSEKYVSLTSYRRSGDPVATPVWVVPDGDALAVWTALGSGKIKRIRRNSQITLAPCTMRGAVTGAPVPARANLLPAEQIPRILSLIRKKYGLIGRFYVWLSLRRGSIERTVGVRITAATAEAD